MTRGSIREYTEAVKLRYLRVAGRKMVEYWMNLPRSQAIITNQVSDYYAGKADQCLASGEDAPDIIELLWFKH